MAVKRKTRSAASRKASAAKAAATRKRNAAAKAAKSVEPKAAKAADKPIGKPKTTARWAAMQAADKTIQSPHCRDSHGLCEKDKAFRAVATAYFRGIKMTGADLKVICPSTRCSFWAKAFVTYLDAMTSRPQGDVSSVWGNGKSLTQIVPKDQRGMAVIAELKKAAKAK